MTTEQRFTTVALFKDRSLDVIPLTGDSTSIKTES